jgi:hypothetical protein
LEPPHDRTVDIVVDGQRIGRGTLMRIGNRTGVRIIAVRERPRHAAGLKRAPAGEALASSEEPAARSVRRERVSDPEADQEAGDIREGICRNPVADRIGDEHIDQRRILDNRDSEASRFGDHIVAGLAASLAADQRHRLFFAVVQEPDDTIFLCDDNSGMAHAFAHLLCREHELEAPTLGL